MNDIFHPADRPLRRLQRRLVDRDYLESTLFTPRKQRMVIGAVLDDGQIRIFDAGGDDEKQP